MREAEMARESVCEERGRGENCTIGYKAICKDLWLSGQAENKCSWFD
jgi:hypothetical protein